MRWQPGRAASSISLLVGLTISLATMAQTTLDPDTILADIKSKGAAVVFDKELVGPKWTYFLHQVETGHRKWLQVAAEIYQATDGGPAEDLGSAPGEALRHHAEDVLTIAVPKIPIDAICEFSEATVGYKGYTTLKAALADIDGRIGSVKMISNPAITDRKMECLKILEISRSEIIHFEYLSGHK